MYKLDNEAVITLRSGDTGKIIWESTQHNDISDDLLCGRGRIFSNNMQTSVSSPWCFLLNDGGAWSGFSFDRTNPSAPYCIQSNNYDHTGAQVDALAQTSWLAAATLFAPYGTADQRGSGPGVNNVNKWRLFYRWTALPVDFQLKALGLTGWQQSISNIQQDFQFGATAHPTIFVPDTLVVLPSSITVHGRNGGATTPDTLEISYFLSVVGA